MNSQFHEHPEYTPDKNKILKKNARKAVNVAALSVIISTFVTYIFVLAVTFLTPILEKLLISSLINFNGDSYLTAKSVSKSFFMSDEYNWFFSVITSVFCSFIPFAVMSKILYKMPPHESAPMKGKIMWSFPFVYCAMTMLATTASGATSSIFSFLLPDAYENAPADIVSIYGNSTSSASLVLCFLSMCVVAPFAEEFIYRGVIFGYLRKFGFVFAAFSSSLFFGLAHATVDQVAYAFVSGLIFCLVAEKTGNLKTGIIIHFLNNLIGYIQAYVLPLTGSERALEIFNTIYMILYGVFAVTGIIVLFVLKKPEPDTDNTETTDKKEATSGEYVPISCFLCVGSIFVILFSVLNLVMGML